MRAKEVYNIGTKMLPKSDWSPLEQDPMFSVKELNILTFQDTLMNEWHHYTRKIPAYFLAVVVVLWWQRLEVKTFTNRIYKLSLKVLIWKGEIEWKKVGKA